MPLTFLLGNGDDYEHQRDSEEPTPHRRLTDSTKVKVLRGAVRTLAAIILAWAGSTYTQYQNDMKEFHIQQQRLAKVETQIAEMKESIQNGQSISSTERKAITDKLDALAREVSVISGRISYLVRQNGR